MSIVEEYERKLAKKESVLRSLQHFENSFTVEKIMKAKETMQHAQYRKWERKMLHTKAIREGKLREVESYLAANEERYMLESSRGPEKTEEEKKLARIKAKRQRARKNIFRLLAWSGGRCHWCRRPIVSSLGLYLKGVSGRRVNHDTGVVQWIENGVKHRGLFATVDHVVPLSWGGSNKIMNQVASCLPCNAARDEIESRVFRCPRCGLSGRKRGDFCPKCYRLEHHELVVGLGWDFWPDAHAPSYQDPVSGFLHPPDAVMWIILRRNSIMEENRKKKLR